MKYENPPSKENNHIWPRKSETSREQSRVWPPGPPARMTACLFWKPIVAVTFYTLSGATQAFTIPQETREVESFPRPWILRRPTSQVAELLVPCTRDCWRCGKPAAS